ncbi:hypothetical protein CHUAL_005353 [Chamberlinius hualienensis]
MGLLHLFTWISLSTLAFSISPLHLFSNQDSLNGQLVYWKGCSSDVQICNLNCLFFISNSSNVSFNWTENESDYADSISVSQWPIQPFLLTNITVDITNNQNYTCKSILSNGTEISSHTFVIDGQQSMPSFNESTNGDEVSFTISDSGSNNCNVSFSCLVYGDPQPVVQWIRYGSDNGSIFGMEISNSTLVKSEDKGAYKYQLDVSRYNSSVNWHYSCLAINNVGFAISRPVVPYYPPGSPILNQTVLPLNYPSAKQTITCESDGGFPAPSMTWEILINNLTVDVSHDFKYTPSDNGKSVLELTIPTSEMVLGMIIKCHVDSDYSGFSESATAAVVNTDQISIVSAKTCSTRDFAAHSSCTLECTAFSLNNVSSQWYYKTNEDLPLELSYKFDSKSSTQMYQNYYTTKLTLDDYYSGYYVCVIGNNLQQANNSFHIATSTGQPINGFCTSSQNCLALNSDCVQSACKCTGDTPVATSDSIYATACVSIENTNCTYSSQCNYENPIPDAYACVQTSDGGRCTCQGVYQYVAEIQTNTCITRKIYSASCVYDEQCQLTDDDLYCTDYNFCTCLPGYYYSYTYQMCYNPYSQYLSMTAALGIAFGIILLICVIFAFIVVLAKSSRAKRRARAGPAMDMANQRPHNNPNDPEWVNLDDINGAAFSLENPPSYVEIRRCETPPPTFEDTIQIKPEQSAVLFLVNANYTEDVAQSESGTTNTAYEHETDS